VRFEVLTVALLKMQVFWDVALFYSFILTFYVDCKYVEKLSKFYTKTIRYLILMLSFFKFFNIYRPIKQMTS
jgi:hypothetical protein